MAVLQMNISLNSCRGLRQKYRYIKLRRPEVFHQFLEINPAQPALAHFP